MSFVGWLENSKNHKAAIMCLLPLLFFPFFFAGGGGGEENLLLDNKWSPGAQGAHHLIPRGRPGAETWAAHARGLLWWVPMPVEQLPGALIQRGGLGLRWGRPAQLAMVAIFDGQTRCSFRRVLFGLELLVREIRDPPKTVDLPLARRNQVKSVQPKQTNVESASPNRSQGQQTTAVPLRRPSS